MKKRTMSKRLILSAMGLCMTLGILATGCQSPEELPESEAPSIPEETPELSDSTEDEAEWTVAGRAAERFEEMRGSNWVGLTTEQMLEDWDFWYDSLRENFGFEGVIQRTSGAKLEQVYREVREQIPTFTSDMDYFIAVNEAVGRLHGGHLNITWIDDDIMSEAHGALCDLVLPVYWELNRLKFEEQAEGDVYQNVTTEILSQNEVAYVKIRGFNMGTYPEDAEILLPFYEEVKDYDHLIIDITGNGGGGMSYYWDLIMAPNIDDAYIFPQYQFMKDGALNIAHMDNRGTPLADFYLPVDQAPADNLAFFRQVWLEQEEYDPLAVEKAIENMPPLPWPPEQMNMDDLAGLDYYYLDILPVLPSNEEKVFQGKIWVLVDGVVYSSSESFAAYCKQSGFATLVGYQTAGDGIGIDPVEFELPNSGIGIRYSPVYGTTLDGRGSEEFGTTPDIISPEGEDPLDTCLQAIKNL